MESLKTFLRPIVPPNVALVEAIRNVMSKNGFKLRWRRQQPDKPAQAGEGSEKPKRKRKRRPKMQVSPSLLQILNLKIDFFYLDSGITCKTLRYILLEIVEVPRQLCLV